MKQWFEVSAASRKANCSDLLLYYEKVQKGEDVQAESSKIPDSEDTGQAPEFKRDWDLV